MANDGTLRLGVDVDEGEFKSGLSKLGKTAGAALGAVTAATGAAAGALGLFAKSSVETGMQFDSAMSQVAATMGMTMDAIEKNTDGAGDTFSMLREKALEMGSSTKFTSQEAAEGLNILAMSGYSATEAVEMIEDVLHLAAAGSMDMASAAGYVSGAMKGFADGTKDSAYYADLMAKGATLANTDVTQLGAALSDGAAAAKSYGQSAETTTLALLRLAEQGEVGTAASTALAAAMKNLYAPTDQAREVLASLGVQAFDPATGSARDFNDVVNELQAALAGYSDEQKTAYAQTVFGIQGFDAYNKMVVTSTEKQEEWAEALGSAAGEAARQYETMVDNLTGDIDTLNSALEGFKIVVADEVIPTLRAFAQGGAEAVGALTEAFESGGVSEAMDVFGDVVSQGLASLLEGIPQALSMGGQLLMAVAEGLLSAVATAAPSLRDAALELLSGLSAGLRENLPSLIESGLELLGGFAESLRENAGLLVDAALDLALNIAKGLADSLPTIVEQVPAIVSNIAGVINDNAPKVLAAGVQIIGTLIKGIIKAIPTLIQNIPAIINAIVDVIMAFNWLNLGGKIVKGLASGIKALIGNIKTTAQTIVYNFKTVIADLPGAMKSLGSDIIRGLINGIKAGFGWIKDSALQLGKTVLGTVKNFFDINSPSKKLRDEVGQYISLGVAAGIQDKSDKAAQAADKMAKEVYSRSKDWAEKNTKYMELSLMEQLELWRTIQGQFVKGSKQYADAEEKVFDLRAKALEDYQKTAETALKNYQSAAEKIYQENEALEKKYQDTLTKRAEEIFKSYKLFDKIPERQKKSGEELMANLRGQISSIEEFYRGLEVLSERGAGAGLADEIRKMGVGASAELEALLSLSDEMLSEYAGLYEEKQALANDLAAAELEQFREETNAQIQGNLESLEALYVELAPGVGAAFTDNLAEGILNGLVNVEDAAATVAQAAVDAAMRAVQQTGSRPGGVSPAAVPAMAAEGVSPAPLAFDRAATVRALESAMPSIEARVSMATASMAPVSGYSAPPSAVSNGGGNGGNAQAPIILRPNWTIQFQGDSAQLGRFLNPIIKEENRRLGSGV